jgi:tetratricopeptide (TPR) repeat protein
MFASLLTTVLNWEYLIDAPWLLAMFGFQVWMLIDAIRKSEWIWAFFIFIGFGLAAFFYYFAVYRTTSATRGFELPGTQKRKRIKELQAQIHHLDKAHHHFQLGDVYFQMGKLDLAETSYRAAMERDSQDIDTRSHLGQCLLRLKRPAEGRPFLEAVVAEKPQHEYGYTQMALAETLTALGETDNAINIWKRVTANNSYARAKVQLAELYLAKNQPQLARPELEEVISDDAHAQAFQRKRDRIWIRKAKSLIRKVKS